MEPVRILKFELYTDSVEFCPRRDRCILAVGMYHLDDLAQHRIGKISFVADTEWEEETFIPNKHSVDLSGGVFDMKWINIDSLLVATSDGLYSIVDQEVSSSIATEDMNLSVDCRGNSGIFSTSKGRLRLVDVPCFTITQEWTAHRDNFESWCVTFCSHSPHTVYSGADDATLKAWDLRSVDDPIFTNKQHSAGVCTIVSLENYLFTGSYDKFLRKFDIRSPLTSVAECQFDSGVWRMKAGKNCLLAACMHDGFHIVDIENIMQRHQLGKSSSLAYGCSWSPDDVYAAGASFYDSTVNVWKLEGY